MKEKASTSHSTSPTTKQKISWKRILSAICVNGACIAINFLLYFLAQGQIFSKMNLLLVVALLVLGWLAVDFYYADDPLVKRTPRIICSLFFLQGVFSSGKILWQAFRAVGLLHWYPWACLVVVGVQVFLLLDIWLTDEKQKSA